MSPVTEPTSEDNEGASTALRRGGDVIHQLNRHVTHQAESDRPRGIVCGPRRWLTFLSQEMGDSDPRFHRAALRGRWALMLRTAWLVVRATVRVSPSPASIVRVWSAT